MTVEQDDVDASTINRLFTSRLDTREGLEKASQAGQTYIRSKIREEGFLRDIIPIQRVTEEDLTRSTNHDTLVKIIDIEHDAEASPLTFRGTPKIDYIQGDRAAIPFYSVSSDRYEKNEQELRAYEYPIQKVIEENSVKEIQREEDGRWIATSNQVVQDTGKVVYDDKDYLNKQILIDLWNLLDGDELEANMVLMNNVTFNDLFTWDNTLLGDQLLGEVTQDGYENETLDGRKIITTNKTNIVGEGELFTYTEPEYLGKFYSLGDVNFWVDKEARTVRWQAWEDIGVGLINTRSVGKAVFGLDANDPRLN